MNHRLTAELRHPVQGSGGSLGVDLPKQDQLHAFVRVRTTCPEKFLRQRTPNLASCLTPKMLSSVKPLFIREQEGLLLLR